MNDVEMLKIITGEKDEQLLSLLLQEAEEKILSLTNRSKMIYPLKPATREWAAVAYNRLGMQGETSRNEAGISSSFAEIPKEIEQAIKKYRLGRVCGHAYEKKPDEELPLSEENTGQGS